MQSLSSSLPEKVLRTALALYMCGEDVTLPLPTCEEVLICNQTTTTEEVSYLILIPRLPSTVIVYLCVHDKKNMYACVYAEGIFI